MDAALRSTMIGAGVGAGLMFLFDPARGARRRSLVRDKAIRATRKTRDALNATQHDLSNRIEGVAAELRRRMSSDTPDDPTLTERVRAELGRIASHPRAIRVTANNGSVALSGDILASEVRSVLSRVRGVRGVREVNSQLNTHRESGGISAMQGRSTRPGSWSSWLGGSWSPTAFVVVGTALAAGVATAVVTRHEGDAASAWPPSPNR